MKKLKVRYLFVIMIISLVIIIIYGKPLLEQFLNGSNNNKNNYYDETIDEDRSLSNNANYMNAVNAYKGANYRIAIDELKDEIRKYPNHAQAYFLLGKIYEGTEFSDGKYYAKMVENYETYISLKPKGKRTSQAKLRVAQYYLQIGLKQNDVNALNKSEEYLNSLDKKDSEVGMALGAIYLNKENYDKAIAEYEKSVNLAPNELRLKYNSLGLAYIKKGLYAKAQKFLEVAVDIDPNDKYSNNNLGFVYVQQGKLKEAAKYFEAALRIDSQYVNARENLQWVEKELSKKQ